MYHVWTLQLLRFFLGLSVSPMCQHLLLLPLCLLEIIPQGVQNWVFWLHGLVFMMKEPIAKKDNRYFIAKVATTSLFVPCGRRRG